MCLHTQPNFVHISYLLKQASLLYLLLLLLVKSLALGCDLVSTDPLISPLSGFSLPCNLLEVLLPRFPLVLGTSSNSM
jgi:hypothetical protein